MGLVAEEYAFNIFIHSPSYQTGKKKRFQQFMVQDFIVEFYIKYFIYFYISNFLFLFFPCKLQSCSQVHKPQEIYMIF